MKKITTIMAMFLIAAMSLGSVTALAAEVPDGSVQKERPAFSINGEGHKKAELTDEQKAALLEKIRASLDEKLATGDITQEEYEDAVAKIEAGKFTFGGKGFQDRKGKPGEKVQLTDEQKAALKEKVGFSLEGNFPAGKPALPKKTASNTAGEIAQPDAAENP